MILAGLLAANFIWADEKIDINAASLEDLTKIIHIGEARAQELISLRPFVSLDDLGRIKGLGEARVKAIKEQGLAWVSEPIQEQIAVAKVNNAPLTPADTKQKSPVLLLAGALAGSSGIIILLLKKSLKQVKMEKI